MKEEKIILNWLQDLPAGIGSEIVDVAQLTRHIDSKVRIWQTDETMLKQFVASVKQECVMNGDSFSFFDIPDLIVRNKYTRAQYDKIKKVLTKVKELFIKDKHEKKQAEKEKANADKAGFDDDISNRKSQT